MNSVPNHLLDSGSQSPALTASVVRSSARFVEQHLEQLKKVNNFLGWHSVLDLSFEAAAAAAGGIESGNQSLRHRVAA